MSSRHATRSRAWVNKKVREGAWSDIPDTHLWASAFQRLGVIKANRTFGEGYKNDLAERELYEILSELQDRGTQGRFHF